jgi:hypothetical protein
MCIPEQRRKSVGPQRAYWAPARFSDNVGRARAQKHAFSDRLFVQLPFSAFVCLRVHVDVPLAGRQLLCLVVIERRRTFGRAFRCRGAGKDRHHNGAFFPGPAGPWK